MSTSKMKVYFRRADGKYRDAPVLQDEEAIKTAVRAATAKGDLRTPWVTVCNGWDQSMVEIVDGAIADMSLDFPEELKPLITGLPNRTKETKRCCHCERLFFPAKPYGDPTATPEEAEQHLSGACSTQCWKDMLGPPPEEGDEDEDEAAGQPDVPPDGQLGQGTTATGYDERDQT